MLQAKGQPAHLKLRCKLAGEAQLAQTDAVMRPPHTDGSQQIRSTSIPRREPGFLHAYDKLGLKRCGRMSCLGPIHSMVKEPYKAPGIRSVTSGEDDEA